MSLENTITSLIPIIRALIHDQQKTDGRNVFEYDSDNKFTLSKSFIDEDSLQVFQNGEELTSSDFIYNSDTNQVEIDIVGSGTGLTADDVIMILFSYYQKYSDTEIQGYINSALSYFVQHRYFKVFEINEDDEIISLNDLEPTTNELYFICIIAAILIDPQNVNIDLPEFKLSANRSDSDEQQIARAFMKFQRFNGEISFNIIEDDTWI